MKSKVFTTYPYIDGNTVYLTPSVYIEVESDTKLKFVEHSHINAGINTNIEMFWKYTNTIHEVKFNGFMNMILSSCGKATLDKYAVDIMIDNERFDIYNVIKYAKKFRELRNILNI